MKRLSQWADSPDNKRLLTIAVPTILILLAGVMVLLNLDGDDLSLWSIPLLIVAVAFVILWQRASITSLAGLALVTLAWSLAELAGSLGILMLGPLVWIWVDQSRDRRERIACSFFACLVALAEGLLSLRVGAGSAVDLVSNLALVVIASAAGGSYRKLSSERPIPEPYRDASDVEPPHVVPPPAWLEELSGREREVLAELVRGASNNDIADHLHISLSTVKTHVSAILKKSGARSRYAAALQVQGQPLDGFKPQGRH